MGFLVEKISFVLTEQRKVIQMTNDLISRQAAIDALAEWHDVAITNRLNNLPPAQPSVSKTETVEDCISRQAAIDATWFEPSYTDPLNVLTEVRDRLKALPSAQPEPLSDAYMKAVWTWLLEYQIKAAELKGRYTPYEVLSWVANDWRKEYERSD